MLLVIVIALLHVLSVNCEDCAKVGNTPPCVCSMEGKRVDLRSLAKNDNSPAFKIDKASDKNSYEYNPCSAFTDGGCSEVAGCQVSDGQRSMGTQDSATFKIDDNSHLLSVTYTGGSGGRAMTVNLVCNHNASSAQFEFVGETSKNQYTFNLTTVCACPGGCNEKGPTGGGGGGGGKSKSHHSSIGRVGIPGIIILSLSCLAFVSYCIAGMIIMRVRYEKTGADIIPHKRLWLELPFYVKDGVKLTFSPCIRSCKTGQGGYKSVS